MVFFRLIDKFKNASITARLVGLGVLFIVALVSVGAVSLLQLNHVGGKLNVIARHDLPEFIQFSQTYKELMELEVVIRNHIIAPYESSPAQFKEKVAAQRDSINAELDEIDASLLPGPDRDLFDQFHAAWHVYETTQDRALELAASNRGPEAIAVLNGQGAQQYNDLATIYQSLADTRAANAAQQEIETEVLVYHDAPLFVGGLIGAALLVVVVLGGLIVRGIVKPLKVLKEATEKVTSGMLSERAQVMRHDEIGAVAVNFNTMVDHLQEQMDWQHQMSSEIRSRVSAYMDFVQKVASGDLRTRLELNDLQEEDADDLTQLGGSLNEMVEDVSNITFQIRESASSVAAAAAEILAAATQQNASTTEQDAAVTQTVATLEELRATISQSSDRAQVVAQTARRSMDVSSDGKEAVENSVDGMNSIRLRVESIAQNILALSERTQQIGEIIATVNEIASQSKLLALNASIEAARAGEEGKGFAVVAMEVRQLAEQSREATERVRDILNEIQQATNTAVMVTEEGSKGAEQGMVLVEHAGSAIQQLSDIIEESAQAAAQIAASASQQTNGMNQLAVAMTSIKQATTQTAASTRMAEQNARNLHDLARQMQNLTSRYRLMEARK